MPRVSRREFLKFLAAGGIAAAAGMAGMSSLTTSTARNPKERQAAAQSLGTWTDGPDTLSHGVHVALLPSGKVLYVAGSGFHRQSASGPFKAGIWDPATDNQTEIILEKDLFCCGHTLLPDGNALFVGGNLKYPFQEPKDKKWWGLSSAFLFNYQTEQFTEISPMAHGRWYPTLVELDDGKVQVVAGYDEFGYHNLLTEIFAPDSESWTISYDPNASKTYCVGCNSSTCSNVPGAGSPCYGGPNQGVNPSVGLYPRMHLMPSGLVAVVGQASRRRVWDPATKRWHSSDSGRQRSYGTSVLLPLQNTADETGQILVCGGSPTTSFPAIATDSADIITPNGFSLPSTAVAPMHYPRRYCNPVILPTGKIIIFGGTQESNDPSLAVYEPDLFDPETQTWTLLPPHAVPRIYHSGALLLPDGRVWTLGTSYDSKPVPPYPAFELRTEIYSPDYVTQPRPGISATLPDSEYGATIDVPTADAAIIAKVSLVKVSTTTHHYNTDQRLIWLQIQGSTSSSVTVKAPVNSKLAPPGYYMLHLINGDGVPSKGAMVKLAAATVQPVFYNVPPTGDLNSFLRGEGDTRAGEEALTGSAIVGKSLKRWTVYLKRGSNPSGPITAKIRRKSDDSIVATFAETVEASTLTTSYAPFEFTLPSPYVINANDRILIEYSGPTGIYLQAWNSDKFDGGLTRRVRYRTKYSGTVQNTKDTVGVMSST
ncbi:MAG TPA: galactose oxidase-like domain-containing protein [Nitrososphaera sp.]|nr:galactose oxidase-like domain-containing protein [Nitrososphaera sp.]